MLFYAGIFIMQGWAFSEVARMLLNVTQVTLLSIYGGVKFVLSFLKKDIESKRKMWELQQQSLKFAFQK